MRETKTARHCGAPEACVSEARNCVCKCPGCRRAEENRIRVLRKAKRARGE